MESYALDLREKVVLVTGSASGIGLETARELIRLGAKVVVADQDIAALDQGWCDLQALDRIAGDVTSPADCDSIVARAVAAAGRLDGVVNAAGVSDRVVPALDADIDEWQRIVDIHLRGAFLIGRSAARVMIDQGAGSIVMFSSVNGLGGIPRRNAYGPAKAAVSLLTRNLACEWARAGVRINAVAPGYIETPLITRLIDSGKIDVARLEGRTPMARIGKPIEVARVVAFLLSDWSSYITGATLPIDGGWMAYGGPGDVETA